MSWFSVDSAEWDGIELALTKSVFRLAWTVRERTYKESMMLAIWGITSAAGLIIMAATALLIDAGANPGTAFGFYLIGGITTLIVPIFLAGYVSSILTVGFFRLLTR